MAGFSNTVAGEDIGVSCDNMLREFAMGGGSGSEIFAVKATNN